MAALPQWLQLLISFFAGLLLGAFFFAGLWWTTRRVVTVKYPALLVLASFLVRSALVLGGFYLLITAGWTRIIAALAGFIIVRLASFFIIRPRKEESSESPKVKGGPLDGP